MSKQPDNTILITTEHYENLKQARKQVLAEVREKMEKIIEDSWGHGLVCAAIRETLDQLGA